MYQNVSNIGRVNIFSASLFFFAEFLFCLMLSLAVVYFNILARPWAVGYIVIRLKFGSVLCSHWQQRPLSASWQACIIYHVISCAAVCANFSAASFLYMASIRFVRPPWNSSCGCPTNQDHENGWFKGQNRQGIEIIRWQSLERGWNYHLFFPSPASDNGGLLEFIQSVRDISGEEKNNG